MDLPAAPELHLARAHSTGISGWVSPEPQPARDSRICLRYDRLVDRHAGTINQVITPTDREQTHLIDYQVRVLLIWRINHSARKHVFNRVDATHLACPIHVN